MTDQTPEARLAAVLDVFLDPEDDDIRRHVRRLLAEWLRDFAKDHGAAAYREGVEDTKMELAADLALAAALRRLPERWSLRHYPATVAGWRWHVYARHNRLVGAGDTPTAAIEEALRDDDQTLICPDPAAHPSPFVIHCNHHESVGCTCRKAAKEAL